MVDALQPFKGACVGCDYAEMAKTAGDQAAANAAKAELARNACEFIKSGKCAVATFLTEVALQPESIDVTNTNR